MLLIRNYFKPLLPFVSLYFLLHESCTYEFFSLFQMSPNRCLWRLTKSITLLALPHQFSTSTTLLRCVDSLSVGGMTFLSFPWFFLVLKCIWNRPSRQMLLGPWTCWDLQRELELGKCSSIQLILSKLLTWKLYETDFMFNCRILLTSTSEVYGDPLEHPQTEAYWGNVNPIGKFVYLMNAI